MTLGEFTQSVIAGLGYKPNGQQEQVIASLARFCSPARRLSDPHTVDRVFVLNGYAGTGKTSLCAALVRALQQVGITTVLMAPTGRAAKVFAAFAGCPASTIHRRIYRHSLNGEVPGLKANGNRNTVFIVDEASMISGPEAGAAGESGLLADLIQYVYSGEGCSMILIGDTAQLPPVGSDFSPAMDTDTLKSMGLSVWRATLTAVARQGALSGILANATWQRRAMRQPVIPEPRIFTAGYSDVRTVSSIELPDTISSAYSRDGVEGSILVTRSNRRAVDFNRAIRGTVLYREEEIEAGELLIVSKNNYVWSQGVRGLDFIANGDMLRVLKVYGTEVAYGQRFADVSLCFTDSDEPVFDAKIMLDTLISEYTSMSPQASYSLYEAILGPAGVGADRASIARYLRQNPYWNALQVKYAYAVTCHKAQGGQWPNVFVDMDYIPEDASMLDTYRWLYTATTRARNNLWFITNPRE